MLRVCGIGEYCSSIGWCGIIAGRAYAEQRGKGKAQGQRGGWAVMLMLSKAAGKLEGSTLFTRGGGRARYSNVDVEQSPNAKQSLGLLATHVAVHVGHLVHAHAHAHVGGNARKQDALLELH